MWFLLALVLGGRTVAEWQEVMSNEEFAEWKEYYQLNPFGPVRGDMQAATICACLANIHAKKGTTFQVKDFLLSFKPHFTEDEGQGAIPPAQVLSFFRGLQSKQHGGA